MKYILISTIIMNKYGTRNTTGYNTYECKNIEVIKYL